MRVPEREIIERIAHNLRDTRDGLSGTNMSRADVRLYQAALDRARLALLALLEESPHDTP